MSASEERSTLAPGVPPDYYEAIFAHEEQHWWYRGMRSIAQALVGDRLGEPDQRVLDAGCGTGGFLRWLLEHGSVARACGVDISSAAIEIARKRVPEAELSVSPLTSLPFADGAFDLVVLNDVIQHVPDRDVDASLEELRRVLDGGGTLLVRTNGARRMRRERDDWRVYSPAALRSTLEQNGFRCERLTHANAVLSLVAAVRGRGPRAPSETVHGIPPDPSSLATTVGRLLLRAERGFLARTGRSIPYGHTLFAVARVAV